MLDSGKRAHTTSPPPLRGSTPTEPPSVQTNCDTIHMPSPHDRLGPKPANFSKARVASSGGIPEPRSRMASSTMLPLVRRTRTSSGESGGEWRKEFSSRLATIRCSFWLSVRSTLRPGSMSRTSRSWGTAAAAPAVQTSSGT